MTQRNVQREALLLRHLGLYRIGLRPLIARACFDGRNPGNVLARLMAEGRVQSRSGLPGRICYYQLTESEAARLGFPVGRARAPRPQALLTHLAVLWHCVESTSALPRRRLDHAEMVKLFGPAFPKGPHVFVDGPSPRVLRALVAGPSTTVRAIVKAARRRIELAHRHPVLGPWVRSRQYAFLILLEGEARRARVLRMVNSHELGSRTELEVAHAPDHRTLSDCLRSGQRGP